SAGSDAADAAPPARRGAGRGAAPARRRRAVRRRPRCGDRHDRPQHPTQPARARMEGPGPGRAGRAGSRLGATGAPMSQASVSVHAEPKVLAQSVAARLIVKLTDAQAGRGSAAVVLTGGRIAAEAYA